MRNPLPLLIASLLLAGTSQAAPRLDPEAKLARALEGRVAGDPVDCVDLRRVRSSRIIDRTAIVYDAGGTIYVNRPRSGSESLDQYDIMVSKLYSSRLCSIDTVQMVDPTSRINTGFVLLGDFVPYRKVRSGD
jgi:hypothetical protein